MASAEQCALTAATRLSEDWKAEYNLLWIVREVRSRTAAGIAAARAPQPNQSGSRRRSRVVNTDRRRFLKAGMVCGLAAGLDFRTGRLLA